MSTLTTCTDVKVRAGSRRWAEARMSGIGASEIAQVLGIAPSAWGSPTFLYYRKTGALPEMADNARMEWGRRLEATIRDRFFKAHPEFTPRLLGRLYRSKERPWQLATPDAVTFDRDGNPVVVEVKTSSSKEGWGPPYTDEVPVYYRAQVMQSMDVVGAEVAWMPVLFNGREYREYRVERDPKDIAILRATGAAMWRQIQERTPPRVDGLEATSRALRGVFTVNPEKQVQVDRNLVVAYARARVLQGRINDLASRLENRLRAQMGDASVALVGTTPVAKRSEVVVSRFDTARLKEERPDVWAAYRDTASRYTRLTFHNPEELK